MRIRTDDEVYRVDAVWLGPPKATFPWRTRYVAWGVGIAVFLLTLTVERQLGIGFSFFSTAWAVVITVVITRLIVSRISHERPLGAVASMLVRELTAPRERGAGRGGTVGATRMRINPSRPTRGTAPGRRDRRATADSPPRAVRAAPAGPRQALRSRPADPPARRRGEPDRDRRAGTRQSAGHQDSATRTRDLPSRDRRPEQDSRRVVHRAAAGAADPPRRDPGTEDRGPTGKPSRGGRSEAAYRPVGERRTASRAANPSDPAPSPPVVPPERPEARSPHQPRPYRRNDPRYAPRPHDPPRTASRDPDREDAGVPTPPRH